MINEKVNVIRTYLSVELRILKSYIRILLLILVYAFIFTRLIFGLINITVVI